mmetsp:Transcript_70464/g.204356  ORF Transcript_70464/g.204356 Transcript_70464/m.204356 type:complete len:178 (-) Transcript_70464:1191-1724(-)
MGILKMQTKRPRQPTLTRSAENQPWSTLVQPAWEKHQIQSEIPTLVAIGETATTEAHPLLLTKGSLIWRKRNAKRTKSEKPEGPLHQLPTLDLHPWLKLTVGNEKKEDHHPLQTLALLLLPKQIVPRTETGMTAVHHLWQTLDSQLRLRLIVRTMISAAMNADHPRLRIPDSQLQLL